MTYCVVQHKETKNWHAEAIGGDGEVYMAIFTGPDAERLAGEYAAWRNSPS